MKSQLLHRKPIKARFKLPMNSETAARYCGMSCKNSLLLAGGCGNGKTTFVYAMQNLINHLSIKNQVTGQNFGISLYNAKDIANICKAHLKDWRSLMDKDILAIDDLGTEPREIIGIRTQMCSVPSSISFPTATSIS